MEKREIIHQVRMLLDQAGGEIVRLCPASADRDEALQLIDKALMFAAASVVKNG